MIEGEKMACIFLRPSVDQYSLSANFSLLHSDVLISMSLLFYIICRSWMQCVCIGWGADTHRYRFEWHMHYWLYRIACVCWRRGRAAEMSMATACACECMQNSIITLLPPFFLLLIILVGTKKKKRSYSQWMKSANFCDFVQAIAEVTTVCQSWTAHMLNNNNNRELLRLPLCAAHLQVGTGCGCVCPHWINSNSR